MSIIWRLICGGKNANEMSGHEQIYPRHKGYLFHHDLAPLKLLGSTTAKPLTGHGNVGHKGWLAWLALFESALFYDLSTWGWVKTHPTLVNIWP